MNKVWRNRALLAIGVAILTLAVYGIQYYMPKAEKDPIAMIEENGAVDVVYYGIGEHESNLLETPTAALGIIYYTPGFEEVDAQYHVRLVGNDMEIIKGRYDWTPDMEESYLDSINLWNFEKFHWRSANAMFAPSQYYRVHDALFYLLDWYNGMMFRDFLYRVFVWVESSGMEWGALEMDFITLNGPIVLPGYTKSGPSYMLGWWPSLTNTLVMFRYRKETIFLEDDNRWIEIRRDPAQEALEAGELTEGALDAMVESKQLQAVGSITPFGVRQYSKGFNHSWQAREIAQKETE